MGNADEPVTTWPVPVGCPLYMDVNEAAEYAGIGQKKMREYLNSSDPPPYLRIGRKRMIETARVGDYLERKQEVRWR